MQFKVTHPVVIAMSAGSKLSRCLHSISVFFFFLVPEHPLSSVGCSACGRFEDPYYAKGSPNFLSVEITTGRRATRGKRRPGLLGVERQTRCFPNDRRIHKKEVTEAKN